MGYGMGFGIWDMGWDMGYGIWDGIWDWDGRWVYGMGYGCMGLGYGWNGIWDSPNPMSMGGKYNHNSFFEGPQKITKKHTKINKDHSLVAVAKVVL